MNVPISSMLNLGTLQREGFPSSTHTISIFLCISLELECYTCLIIFSTTLTRWPTFCKREITTRKCRAYFIIHSSRWWSCIISSKKKFHGIPSLPMRFSLPYLFIMSRIYFHHLILLNPFLHHIPILRHLHLLTSIHLMFVLPHHLSTTLHPHIMIPEPQVVKEILGQLTLKCTILSHFL